MPTKADPAVRRVVLSYSDASRQVRRRVESFVQRTWRGLPDYRSKDIDRFVARVVPVVVGGQRRVSTLTDAYLAAVETNVLGKRARPVGVPADVISHESMRGVSAADVYQRPGVATWTALSNGVSFLDAVEVGMGRALDLAATDLQLARTHTTRHIFASKGNVFGYRRVPGGARVCALCAVAATQRYHKEDLMPIHPGCGCDVEPIYGDEDPGQVIDPDGLEGIHDEISQRFGVSDRGARDPIDYRKVVVTRDHGEIGPVLTVKGQNFTGPRDL